MAVWRTVAGPPVHRRRPRVLRGPRPAGDDRDRERPVLHRGARGAARGRGREPGQEHVPRGDEPRDPDADERDHRDERAAARHAPGHRAAGVRGDDQDLGRRPADGHQRHPRLLQDRGRQGRARCPADGPPAYGRGGARPACRGGRQPRRRADLRGGRRAADGRPRRSRADPPDRHQPPLQRAQVHRLGRGGAPSRRARGREPPGWGGAALGDHGHRPRHRHRHPARGDGPPVPVVQPGRRVDLTALRRDGPRARDQPAPRRAHGRLADRGEQRRRGRGQHLPPHDPRRRGRPAGAGAPARPRRRHRPRGPRRGRQRDQPAHPRRAARALGDAAAHDALAGRGPGVDPRRRGVRPRDPRLPHARDGRPRAGPRARRRAPGGPDARS